MLIRVLRLFSADWALDPLAVANTIFGIEAMYCPPDSETLPEYCFPPTVRE